jgi:hypothetical protein
VFTVGLLGSEVVKFGGFYSKTGTYSHVSSRVPFPGPPIQDMSLVCPEKTCNQFFLLNESSKRELETVQPEGITPTILGEDDVTVVRSNRWEWSKKAMRHIIFENVISSSNTFYRGRERGR